MDGEERALEIYRERVTKVESQIEVITIKQNNQQALVERLTLLLEKVSGQMTTSELAAVAIRERTEQHAKTIEHLQEREADISNILASMKTQLSILKYISGAIATVIIGYLFSHFVK